MEKGKIVVVDDDVIITSAFSRLLKVEGFSDAHFYNSPKDALEFLKNNQPDLVISDFLMVEMNGLEFLSEVKKLYPEVSRILLTSYADKENAIRAINEVGLYRYIEKPWSNDDLIINIKNGIDGVMTREDQASTHPQRRGSDDNVLYIMTDVEGAEVGCQNGYRDMLLTAFGCGVA